MLARVGRQLWAPVGSPQVQVVWRLIGWAMLLAVLRARGGQPLAIDPSIVPWPYHAIAATAALLVLLGPRLPLLAAAGAAWVWQQAHVLSGVDPHHDFVADEHLLFMALPILGALSAGVTLVEQRGADPSQRDAAVTRGQLWHLRMCTVVALGFAALHKLNSDFLAAETSCATLLGGRLAATWGLPDGPLSPLAVVLAEALAPALLLLVPRLGALWLVVLATGLGHVGPYAFNALLAALALAFLSAEAADAWSRRAARAWPFALVGVIAVGLVSRHLYHGRGAWWPYLLFEATVVLVAWLIALAPRTPGWRPARGPRPWLPGRFAHRSLCGYAALFMIVHGMSPYLGLKYRHGFAMLSNLRVDDDRWNSLVVPRALYLRSHDPFVHVLRVADASGAPVKARRDDRDALRPGNYGPQEFRRRYEAARKRWQPISLRLRHRGVERDFGDLRFDRDLAALVAGLPRAPLFQDALAGPGRQSCVH